MIFASSAPQGLAPSGWSRLDDWLLVYLFLPVPIFLLGFLLPWAGVPAAVFALVAFVIFRPFGSTDKPRWCGQLLVGSAVLVVFAAAWTSLGGAGHIFHANGIDWVPRYGVLRDLVVNDWPPRYLDESNNELILRAPVGYYLVPALLGKLSGIAWADLFLLLWTWLGVSLFFLANFAGTLGRRLSALILFAAASGLDIVGFLWMSDGYLPNPGYHIEWWAGRIQYSSNTTLLFWVPNHALPGWIAAAWLWRFRDDPRFIARLPVLFLPVMLWSPLPAIGLLPLAMVAAWLQWYRGSAQWAEFFKSLLLVAPAAGLVAAYLLMGAGKINAGVSAALQGQSASEMGFDIWRSLIFFMLEAGLFGMLALQRNRSPLMIASLVVLAVLPLFSVGPNNDLAMRGSTPALTILWMVLIDELTARPSQRALSSLMRGVLVILWLLGMATPFQEIYRALSSKHWAADTALSAPAALGGFPSHYFASAANRFATMLNPTEPAPASKMNWKRSR